jgi:probable HAF family extracellular repeat protein
MSDPFQAQEETDGRRQRRQSYNISVLGTLPGYDFSTASGINEKGHAVGASVHVDPSNPEVRQTHAVLWKFAQIFDLGTLAGSNSICGSDHPCSSSAAAINDENEIVGSSDTAQGEIHAFLWRYGKMRDLGTLGAGRYSFASGINDRGQVVGASCTTDSPFLDSPFTRCGQHAFLWEDGNMRDLGILPQFEPECTNFDCSSFASGINEAGQVVGASVLVTPEAFLWENGQMNDLGRVDNFTRSLANGINDKGQVAGLLFTSSYGHASLWQGGQAMDLGTLSTSASCDGGPPCNSQAAAINNRTQVVGYSQTDDPGHPNHAFLWENGQMIDLNALIHSSSGWVVSQASGINNRGQIVGGGYKGQAIAVLLLTPSHHRQGDEE